MKKIFSLILIFVCLKGLGQFPNMTNPQSLGAKKTRVTSLGAFDVDSILMGPTGCGSPTLYPAFLGIAVKKVAYYFDSCNHRYWIYDPKIQTWDSVHLGVASGGGSQDLDNVLHVGNTSDTSIVLLRAGAGDIGVAAFNGDGAGVILGTIDDIGFVTVSRVGGFTGRILAPLSGSSNDYFLPSASGTLALTSQLTDSLFGVQDNSFTDDRSINAHGAYIFEWDSIPYFGFSNTNSRYFNVNLGASDPSAEIFLNQTGGNQLTAILSPSFTSIWNVNGGGARSQYITWDDGILLHSQNVTGTSELYVKNSDGIRLVPYHGLVTVDSIQHKTDTTGLYILAKGRGDDYVYTIPLNSVGGGVTPSTLVFAESVIESNDSVFLEGEKIQPASDGKVYGQLTGSKGFKQSAILNQSVNVEHNDLIRYDSTAQEYYTFHTREMLGRLEFKARADGWILPGDSLLIDSNFIASKIRGVWVDGIRYTTLPSPDDKWYEHNDLAGIITIHPSPTNDSSEVIVETVWSAMFTDLSRRVAPTPWVWTDFDFDNVTDLSEISPNIWAASGGADCTDNYGLSNTTIGSGADGAIRSQYFVTDNSSTIGLDVANTQTCYTSFDAWISVAAGVVYCGGNGTTLFTSGSIMSDGYYFGIFREGSVFTARVSSDGVNWTTLYTYATTSTATQYIKMDGYSFNKIYYPQKSTL